MQPWSNRITEEAHLFNPAFCGVLIAQMSDDYAKKTHRSMPFPLAFLSLPSCFIVPPVKHFPAQP